MAKVSVKGLVAPVITAFLSVVIYAITVSITLVIVNATMTKTGSFYYMSNDVLTDITLLKYLFVPLTIAGLISLLLSVFIGVILGLGIQLVFQNRKNNGSGTPSA